MFHTVKFSANLNTVNFSITHMSVYVGISLNRYESCNLYRIMYIMLSENMFLIVLIKTYDDSTVYNHTLKKTNLRTRGR